MRTRSYSELSQIEGFDERFRYLALRGRVGDVTFGFERVLNQAFYHSAQWKRARRIVLLRDNNCDMGVEGYDIPSDLHIHHMNPVRLEDIRNGNPDILNPEYLISTTQTTHNAIHYGNESLLPQAFTERRPGDTWI